MILLVIVLLHVPLFVIIYLREALQVTVKQRPVTHDKLVQSIYIEFTTWELPFEVMIYVIDECFIVLDNISET